MSAAERRRPARVTLDDVARQADVSRALVSIVMRGVPGASQATRERVRAVADELGYRPDVRARSLAGQKSRLVGVMFGVGVGAFHFDLLEGLYTAAEEQGLHLVLTALTGGRDERLAAESLEDFGIDGLVMLGPPTTAPLLAGQAPVVVVGWYVEDPAVDVFRSSDEHGMRQAVDHLVRLGHRRIAHIDGGEVLIAGSRREAYAAAMRAHDLETEIRVVAGGQTQIDGQRAARTLLAQGDLPTALVAYNDDVAVAAMGLLAQQGVDVPGDLSVIGYDDNQVAALSPVPLTSVAQRPTELARLAIERILARTRQQPISDREVVLEPELKVRDSTARPRTTTP